MKKLTEIAAEDFAISTIMPLLCLAKACKEGRPSAQSEAIVLEAVEDFGLNEVLIESFIKEQKRSDGSVKENEYTQLSKVGYHFAKILRRKMNQKDISLMYSLKEAMMMQERDDNYLADTLFFATRIFSLKMSRQDRLAKAIFFDRIRNLLDISEKDLADYPVLVAALKDITHETPHIHVEKAKRDLQEQIAEEDMGDYLDTAFLTIEDTLATISTEGIDISFDVGVNGVTTKEFIDAVARSFSLDKKEKEMVLEATPTLSLFQVEALMQTFEDEATKFQELSKEHPGDTYKLSIKQRLEWLELKKDFAKEKTQNCAMDPHKHGGAREAAA